MKPTTAPLENATITEMARQGAPIKRLSLKRETVKELRVRTGIQTGFMQPIGVPKDSVVGGGGDSISGSVSSGSLTSDIVGTGG